MASPIRSVISWFQQILRRPRADVTGWLWAFRRIIETSSGGPPAVAHDRKRPLCLALDGVWIVDPGSAYLSGWIWDPNASIQELSLIPPSGHEVTLENRLTRVRRPDVTDYLGKEFGRGVAEKNGFVSLVEDPSLQFTPKPFRLRARLKGGGQIAVSRKPMLEYEANTKQHLMESLASGLGPSAAGFVHRDDADQKPDDRATRPDQIVRGVASFGSATRNPKVSVIVPLFRTLTLFEAQFGCLARDPYLRECELIFVLDSPEMDTEFEQLGYELQRIYELPMKLVILERNSGYSHANNIGASYARAPYLLFLNSDVFPIKNYWLRDMKDFCSQETDGGPLGAKLRYEDDALQHAGMYFSKDVYPGRLWQNLHYFKGFPHDYPAANVPRKVPAVTGACMMLSRERFDLLEGWDESYGLMNFEDSDLCVRAYLQGLKSWYLPSVELYHLEKQSQRQVSEQVLRRGKNLYNCWLQTERWDSVIEEIMRGFPVAAGDTGSASHPSLATSHSPAPSTALPASSRSQTAPHALPRRPSPPSPLPRRSAG